MEENTTTVNRSWKVVNEGEDRDKVLLDREANNGSFAFLLLILYS